MERDKKLRKASFLAQPLGHAASTLAQSIGMDQDKVLTWVQKLLSFDPSFPLFLSLSLSLFFSLFWTGPTFVDLSCVSSRLIFAPKSTFRAKKEQKSLMCSHRHTTVIAGPTCLIAHLLAPHDRAQSLGQTSCCDGTQGRPLGVTMEPVETL